MNKLLVFTAPSGAGKTTIVQHLLKKFPQLAFSVSATTRTRRPGETDGVDYYFLEPLEFQRKIEAGAFVEWEEVYANQYYGTLRTELERLWRLGKDIIFDIDVKGALSLKEQYGERALTVFIRPPSLQDLEQRLRDRQTEDEKNLQKRLRRMSEELNFENKFDRLLVNDVLSEALAEAESIVSEFILDHHENGNH